MEESQNALVADKSGNIVPKKITPAFFFFKPPIKVDTCLFVRQPNRGFY